MTNKFQAIKSLRPNKSFEMDGDIVKFLDGVTTVPTEAEIAAEISRLQAEEAANAYKAQRAQEYPSIGDQLDALWKGGAEAEAMLAKVQAVKQKYPKGVA